MRTVKEVSQMTGVSIRTLHHYHAIGLLIPTRITEAGYRLYDDEALRKLQQILLLRELQFELKDIKTILDNPHYDPLNALEEQIRLLTLQRARLDQVIAHAKKIQQKGVFPMNFSAFDQQNIDAYKEEARRRWGHTDAWQESETRAAGRDEQKSADGMMQLFAQLGTLRHLSPDDAAVQAQIQALRDHITQHYYNCTVQILCSLGQMYVQDERFTQNIDNAGGEGTAEFAGKAIAIYCSTHQ